MKTLQLDDLTWSVAENLAKSRGLTVQEFFTKLVSEEYKRRDIAGSAFRVAEKPLPQGSDSRDTLNHPWPGLIKPWKSSLL